MAFKCGEATWASMLPLSTERDDGTIFVDRVHGSGNMEGRHRRKGASPGQDEQIRNGKCKAGPEKIEFDREGFHYDGEIFDCKGRFVIVGKRSSAKDKRDGEDVVDGEVWVGVKTGT